MPILICQANLKAESTFYSKMPYRPHNSGMGVTVPYFNTTSKTEFILPDLQGKVTEQRQHLLKDLVALAFLKVTSPDFQQC